MSEPRTLSRMVRRCCLALAGVAFAAGCTSPTVTRSTDVAESTAAWERARNTGGSVALATCTGPYRSFWNDPTNTPPPEAPHVFRLSQSFPRRLPDGEAEPWKRFDPFSAQSMGDRAAQSLGYIRAVLDYIFEGNVGEVPSETDFDLCHNPIRPWFHVPWMDANPSKGREYVRGLTRELAPGPRKLGPGQVCAEVAWAVGFYNARGGHAIGTLFPGTSSEDVVVPTQGIRFPAGTVVGKALFTSASADQVDYLRGAPIWTANILPPACGGQFSGTVQDPCRGQQVTCERRLTSLRLAQFDVAVVDDRAPLQWVFGTFIYDGRVDATRGWRGLRPVGLMWGNDPGLMPEGTDPGAQEPDRRGLTPPEKVKESYMFTSELPPWLQKDLGCAGRLDGPIDNPRSACMSCHASASVPFVVKRGETNPCSGTPANEDTVVRAPILGNFDRQCGNRTIDDVWFRNISAGEPLDHSSICRGRSWASLDYSLQLGDALANYLTSRLLAGPPASPAARDLSVRFPRALRELNR